MSRATFKRLIYFLVQKEIYPMIPTQKHTVLKVMTWEGQHTSSLYVNAITTESSRNLTCASQTAVTHALKDKLHPQEGVPGWLKLMQLGGKHVR